MIARLWRGTVPVHKAQAYLDLMRRVALPNYRSTPGNMGAWTLSRIVADHAEIQMLTFWKDEESVKAFAGADPEQARYYDFDDDFLISKPPKADHFEIDALTGE